MNIPMQRDTREEWTPDTPVGRFDIREHRIEGYPEASGTILFTCPLARRTCTLLIGPQPCPPPDGERLWIWGWDGDLERPTLTPSIDCHADGCGWHGFIREGVML